MLNSRTMALDVGDARIGVAISDPLGMSAQPLCTVERKKNQHIEKIKQLCLENNVATIVVGLPKELDGNIGDQAKKVQRLVEQVQGSFRKSGSEKLANIQFAFWDERLTTVEAQRVITGSGLKNKDRRAALDRISAAIILEGYLSSKSINP